jgi:uncharacterized repeat protein (TIGR04076 family)
LFNIRFVKSYGDKKMSGVKKILTKKILKKRLGYSDEEVDEFLQNPKNKEILSMVQGLTKKRLVLEVVESHGCNSQHKVGDRFIFDAFGNLQTRLCPDQVCMFMLAPAQNLLYAGMELLLSGVDPNEMKFNRTNCVDVGLECGGWGRVVVELKAEDV